MIYLAIIVLYNNILLCRCDLSGDYCIVFTQSTSVVEAPMSTKNISGKLKYLKSLKKNYILKSMLLVIVYTWVI